MNFLVAYRSLLRNKFYAFINILGLGLGLSTCILIGIFIKDELSFDKHWKNGERIYRVSADIRFNNNTFLMANSPAPMAESFKEDFPEIKEAARFRDVGQNVINIGETYYNQRDVVFVDQSMLRIFQLDFKSGNPENALGQPNSAIIDATTAQKLFGTEDAVGKVFEMSNNQYSVQGVYSDIPDNSHFHFPVMISMLSYPDAKSPMWLSNNFKTYFLLDENNDHRSLQDKFEGVYEKYFGPQFQQFAGVTYEQMLESGSYLNYYLTPVFDIHLKSNLGYEIEANGNMQYVWILFAAGIFVLIIAAINFMNISTARSSVRAKEVGMRKVMGGVRRQLVFQFLIESILNAFLALILAVGLTYLMLPFFNNMADKSIMNPFFGTLALWKESLTLTILVGLLAGLYPAFYLSRFAPIKVLKGQLTLGVKSGSLRNVLVITQFIASVMLIFGSMVIYSQLRFTQTKSLGFDKDQVIIINETYTLDNSIRAFRDELKNSPAISNASMSSFLPTGGNRSDSPLMPEGATSVEEAVIGIQLWLTDENYVPTLNLNILEGRNFSSELASDTMAVIVNEAALKEFGYENPIGEKVYAVPGFDVYGRTEYQIIGIVEDFHFDHFKNKIGPVALFYGNSTGKVILRYEASQTESVQEYVQATWEKFNPSRPLNYDFMDQQFAAKYESEEKLGKLFGSFAIISIVIACLGLFGLAAFTSDQKKKEIGVRKVLGATVNQLMMKQLSSYTKLLGISLLLGLPTSHYLMSNWLENFAYKTDISLLVYLAPSLLILVFAWSTVSIISFKAAMQNPVNNLHQE